MEYKNHTKMYGYVRLAVGSDMINFDSRNQQRKTTI